MTQYSKALLFIISALVFCNSALLSQDTLPPLPETWSLQQCLDYAFHNNITLNTLRLSRQSSEQDLLLSRSSRQPNLTGSASQYINRQRSVNTDGSVSGNKVNSSGSYSVGSSVVLYNGGYIGNDIRQKSLSLDAAGLTILQQQNNITLELTQDYLNILLARENIVYLEDLLNTSLAQVARAQQQYDVGSIALKDLVQLQAQAAGDKYTLITAQNTERQYLLLLKQLLQLPAATPFNIIRPDTLIAKALVPSVAEVQQIALATRPEVKIADLNLENAQISLQQARTTGMPALSASGAIGTSGATAQNYTYLKQLDNGFYQQAGITLSVPIFTRRAVKTAETKARIGIAQSQLDLQNTKISLSYTIEQAYINVQNAQSQYDAAVEQLKYTQESYRIANEQLKVGVANTVEFLQQKNTYIQALQSYIQAKYNAALTIRIYDFYRGVPVTL
jgi:outer membrane protein